MKGKKRIVEGGGRIGEIGQSSLTG